MTETENILVLVFAGLLGLICGSFVTALSYRLPRGEDFVSGRSRCPKCETALSALDLVPVVSWLVSRGRCRHCKTPVSARYPAIELLCGALFVGVLLTQSPPDLFRIGVLLLLTIALLALCIVDLEFRRLPNSLVLFVAGLTAALAWIDQSPPFEIAFAVIIALALGLVLRMLGHVVHKKPGMGWGDIKLCMAVAVALTAESVPVFCLSFGGIALVLAVWFGRQKGERHIPLGPALCAGAYAAFL